MIKINRFFMLIIIVLLGVSGAEGWVIYKNADLPNELLAEQVKAASLELTLKGEEARTRYALDMATKANYQLYKSVGQCVQRIGENLEHLEGIAPILQREWKIELARACQK